MAWTIGKIPGVVFASFSHEACESLPENSQCTPQAFQRVNPRFHGEINDAFHPLRAGFDCLCAALVLFACQRFAEYQRYRQYAERKRHRQPAGRQLVRFPPLVPCGDKNGLPRGRKVPPPSVGAMGVNRPPPISSREINRISDNRRHANCDDDRRRAIRAPSPAISFQSECPHQ